ncbi:iron ABC transporter ATP-binding protein [Ochrobactrum sp. 695/2009]|nr:iron ABC transporter ATP-binding protein [Ochrobactrum sp. 721/2009]PJT14053.1 iron ABC transporter ATP-binding protein [Ochrobactrum sp. 720/2009]PJT24222.1 iron ABC transporter ATP-binding protein [Ochrobactrum sp. 715/2009]PJT30453.1 iron ABC transporter ATP-binding protein [Ochrobactrum sp. 695/2009]PJT33980.1 iron ABC transporter ATP-binding protein [Ochrobactrum sp. 689/2009]
MDAARNPHDKRPVFGQSGPALTLSGITRQFGAVRALNDVSLDVHEGEIICLVGHSGCGKTSLLRIIAGIDVPDSGTLAMGGQTLVGPSVFIEPEKRNVGVVFQDYALFPHLTVRENILFGLRRMPRHEADARTQELLELVSLSHMADRYPHMLSGGEQQRVALIRALAPKPQLLLMDEPFSNLDRGLRARVRSETVALLRELGTTAIIVTHEAEEALSTGDRVVLMRSGEVVQKGPARELHDRPVNRYAADFFCDFNAIPGKVEGNGLVTPFGKIAISAQLGPDAEAFAYLRPRDFTIVTDCETGEASLRAHIESRTFLGEIEELLVRVTDAAPRLRVRTELRLPASSNDIVLRPHWDKALIFPK